MRVGENEFQTAFYEVYKFVVDEKVDKTHE